MKSVLMAFLLLLALALPGRAQGDVLEFKTNPGGDVVAVELSPEGQTLAEHRPAEDSTRNAARFRIPADRGRVHHFLLKRENFADMRVAFAFVTTGGRPEWAWKVVPDGGAWPAASEVTGEGDESGASGRGAGGMLYFSKTLAFRTKPEATRFTWGPKKTPLVAAADGKVILPQACRANDVYAERDLFLPATIELKEGALDIPGAEWPPAGQPPVALQARYGPFSYRGVQVGTAVVLLVGAVYGFGFVLPKRRALRKDELRRLKLADKIASETEAHLTSKGTLPPLIGQTVATESGEEFLVLKLLGEGGMGAVFESASLRPGTPEDERWALKVLFSDIWANPDYRQRFQREAEVCARLTHPGIVKVRDWGTYRTAEMGPESDGLGFMVMEMVQGEELAAYIEDGRTVKMPVDQVLGWGEDVLKALATAHSAGILHRDLKPANIMITTAGRAKVMDFGLVRDVDKDSLTQTGTFMGTPLYMSPEHIDAKRAAPASDLYSLGVVLYEALTGRLPYDSEGMASIIASILYDDPVPIQEARPDLPERVCGMIMRMLEKDLSQRYITAHEVLAEMENIRQEAGAP